jgi:hypothetical protein
MKDCQALSAISSVTAGLPGDSYKQACFLELFEPAVDVVHMRDGFLLNSFPTLNTNGFHVPWRRQLNRH